MYGLHVHVQAAYPCPGYMPVSMLHFHVHATCTVQCTCPHWNVHVLMLLVHAAQTWADEHGDMGTGTEMDTDMDMDMDIYCTLT